MSPPVLPFPIPAVNLPFLDDLVILFVAAVLVATVCFRLHIPPIAGFLIAGVLIGPNALGLIAERELVDILAEIGVILLLFSIGVEFSLEKISRLSRAIFIGGGLQVSVTVAVVAGIAIAAGVTATVGIYTGLLVSLSSTAIVLGILAERDQIDTPAGGLMLAVLIFQDLAVVLMVLLVPALAGQGGGPIGILLIVARALGLIAVTLILARKAVPWLLERIARTRQPELFLLTVVSICFGIAAVSALFGVSVALGAFLAGLVVSESRFRDQALSDVLPLRVLFNAVFFVSIGMLLDLGFVLSNPVLVLGVASGALLIKFGAGLIGLIAIRYPVRIAAVAAASIAQIGEFSFVLERAGAAAGLSPAGMGSTGQQVFIASSVLLMVLTPFMMSGAGRMGHRLTGFGRRDTPTSADAAAGHGAGHGAAAALEDHVIIVGYGHAGHHLSRVFGETGIPYLVIEMNPQTIDNLAEQGIPYVIGDAAGRHILEMAGVKRAKIVCIVVNDESVTSRIAGLVRFENPTVQIVVRTRHIHRIEALQDAGADIVVPEELETTARIYAHILGAYMIPPKEIEQQMRTLRAGDYGILRGSIQEAHLMVLEGLDEDGLHSRAVAVRSGAPAAGSTLAELALRREHRLTVLAVRRGSQTISSPAGDFRLEAGDRLVMIGTADQFLACGDLFREPAPPLSGPSPGEAT